jgi:hypothetical protein
MLKLGRLTKEVDLPWQRKANSLWIFGANRNRQNNTKAVETIFTGTL